MQWHLCVVDTTDLLWVLSLFHALCVGHIHLLTTEADKELSKSIPPPNQILHEKSPQLADDGCCGSCFTLYGLVAALHEAAVSASPVITRVSCTVSHRDKAVVELGTFKNIYI